jgi:hypothetical protein
MPVNAAQQMIGRDVVVEAEVVKQLSRCRLNAHHRRLSRKSAGFNESRRYTDNNQSLTFSTVSTFSGHCRSPPRTAQLGGKRVYNTWVGPESAR